ncbi:MAG: hypothetical protein IKY33_02025 [Clostridia bacterium]|nr:hypothetical protein [Clostridia bacterium]
MINIDGATEADYSAYDPVVERKRVRKERAPGLFFAYQKGSEGIFLSFYAATAELRILQKKTVVTFLSLTKQGSCT